MTTRLNGGETHFLPFNKGHNNGKGNPPNPNGHKSAYLWLGVFKRESLANIIQHFVRFDGNALDGHYVASLPLTITNFPDRTISIIPYFISLASKSSNS